MKRHHRAPAGASVDSEPEGRRPGLTEQIASAASEITIKQCIEPTRAVAEPGRQASYEQTLKPRAAHTLVLIGELDRGSTHTLEAEIEHLCALGTTTITLDLSRLSGIDSTGVAVVAFRSRWCRRRGCELALIPGAPPIQRAFELAGVADALTFEAQEEATATAEI